jgi:ubiquitin C-terminal hydrolase
MQDDAKKTLQFSSTHLPSVLVLTLKRFAHRDMSSVYGSRGVGHTEKLDGDVDFPLDGLDLSPYCHSPDGQDSWTTNDAIYDLFAVCNHYGRMGFGHYSAFARDWLLDGQLSKQWVAFDDDDVRLVNENNVKTNAAYILFYKRRNTM